MWWGGRVVVEEVVEMAAVIRGGLDRGHVLGMLLITQLITHLIFLSLITRVDANGSVRDSVICCDQCGHGIRISGGNR